MTKIAIIATMDLAPGRRDEYLVELLAHRRRSLEGEAGTLVFEVLVPRDEPDRIMLYEVYADDQALDAHRNGASMAEIARNTKGMLVRLTGLPCSPVE